MSQMRLLGNRLLLGLIKPALKTDSGIMLPEAYQDDRQRWIVVQTGSKYKGDLKAGDQVICTGWQGNQYDFDDGRIIVGPQTIKTDIIAVWTSLVPPATVLGSASAAQAEPSQATAASK